MAEELVAFANLQGGRVLLGVDHNGSVLGLTRVDPLAGTEEDDEGEHTYQRLEEWVMQACRDKVRPEIVPYFEIFRDVEPNRDVAAVQVERGWSVHHVWHNQRRTYYIRVGSVSREASAEELARLFQQRGAFRPELRPVSGASITDLDLRRLEDYFGQVRQQRMPASTPSDDWRREFLDDGDRRPATVAGLLLFGSNPSRYLPQAKIHAVAYFGQEKDYDARERRTLRGPMVRLKGAGGAVVEPGLAARGRSLFAEPCCSGRLAMSN